MKKTDTDSSFFCGRIKMPIYVDTSADNCRHNCRYISAQMSTYIGNSIIQRFSLQRERPPPLAGRGKQDKKREIADMPKKKCNFVIHI
ncbi:hypothetical protein D0T51_10330 [Parabacteroides sp. 52]|nr:hypothetical protein [Parabacteroides sp. 52]